MRKPWTYLTYLVCFVFSLHLKAQNIPMHAAPASDIFKHITPLYFFHNLNLTQTQPSPGSLPLLKHAYGADVITSGSINDMPFFCAMECRLRERTRLWIKFRTGDDASYEKLIHSGKK